MTPRSPEQILEEFGRDLLAVRPRRRWRVWTLAALLASVIAVPTAVATRPIWAPQDPAVNRPADAPRPLGVGRPAVVARGAGWTLAASICTFRHHTTVVVFLKTPTGGAGRRCEALTSRAAAGPVAPPATYVDPATHEVLLFGAVPPGITGVRALIHRSGRRSTELREIPLQDSAFVAPLPEDARVLTVVGLDARGEPRLHCDTRACEERQ